MSSSTATTGPAALLPQPAFYWPIKPSISSPRIRLVPFSPTLHLPAFVAAVRHHPQVFQHMPMGPLASEADLLAQFASADSILSLANPSCFQFAALDRTSGAGEEEGRDEPLAGTLSFIHTSEGNLSTEIGFVTVLPAFQGKGVGTHAVALLMQYALTSVKDGGLGLRRLHWHTSSMNIASQKLAVKMSFKYVGVIEWHMRFPKGRLRGKVSNGKPIPPDGDPDDLWRDTLVYSLGWDQWEGGLREKIRETFGEAQL